MVFYVFLRKALYFILNPYFLGLGWGGVPIFGDILNKITAEFISGFALAHIKSKIMVILHTSNKPDKYKLQKYIGFAPQKALVFLRKIYRLWQLRKYCRLFR